MNRALTLNYLLIISIILWFVSCGAQNERIEIRIMDCSYSSFEDGGKELKGVIADYEKMLIEEEILSNNSGKSYHDIFEQIASGNSLKRNPSKFFAKELKKLKKPDLSKMQDCQKILASDSLTYNTSKLKALESAILNIKILVESALLWLLKKS